MFCLEECYPRLELNLLRESADSAGIKAGAIIYRESERRYFIAELNGTTCNVSLSRLEKWRLSGTFRCEKAKLVEEGQSMPDTIRVESGEFDIYHHLED